MKNIEDFPVKAVLDTFFPFRYRSMKKTLELIMGLLLSGRVDLREAIAEFKFVSRPGLKLGC